MYRLRKYGTSNGFTLAELLIVVAIISIIALIFLLMSWRKSINAGKDVQRKTDLVNIRRAFEEYYNDHECYPPADILTNCNGNQLLPTLERIPCDPVSGQPYLYTPESDTNLCIGNRLCAKLQDLSDPDITKLGCDPVAGCGWGAYWNYCLANGTTSTGLNPITPTPTPIPAGLNGSYACRGGIQVGGVVVWIGSCNNVGDPTVYRCTYSFVESDCQNLCGQIAYWCLQ